MNAPRAHTAKDWIRVLAVLAAWALLAAGCEQQGKKERNPSGLFVVTQGGRAGYIDRTGKFVWNPSK